MSTFNQPMHGVNAPFTKINPSGVDAMSAIQTLERVKQADLERKQAAMQQKAQMDQNQKMQDQAVRTQQVESEKDRQFQSEQNEKDRIERSNNVKRAQELDDQRQRDEKFYNSRSETLTKMMSDYGIERERLDRDKAQAYLEGNATLASDHAKRSAELKAKEDKARNQYIQMSALRLALSQAFGQKEGADLLEHLNSEANATTQRDMGFMSNVRGAIQGATVEGEFTGETNPGVDRRGDLQTSDDQLLRDADRPPLDVVDQLGTGGEAVKRDEEVRALDKERGEARRGQGDVKVDNIMREVSNYLNASGNLTPEDALNITRALVLNLADMGGEFEEGLSGTERNQRIALARRNALMAYQDLEDAGIQAHQIDRAIFLVQSVLAGTGPAYEAAKAGAEEASGTQKMGFGDGTGNWQGLSNVFNSLQTIEKQVQGGTQENPTWTSQRLGAHGSVENQPQVMRDAIVGIFQVLAQADDLPGLLTMLKTEGNTELIKRLQAQGQTNAAQVFIEMHPEARKRLILMVQEKVEAFMGDQTTQSKVSTYQSEFGEDPLSTLGRYDELKEAKRSAKVDPDALAQDFQQSTLEFGRGHNEKWNREQDELNRRRQAAEAGILDATDLDALLGVRAEFGAGRR